MRTLFETPKVVIGMIHVKAMPGFPNSLSDMGALITSAVEDAHALVRGGVDGLIVENIFNRPRQKTVGPETIAPMALVVKAVVDAVDVPVGIKVLFNDYRAALGIANCTGARFVRISVYTDAAVTMAGIIEGCAYDAVSYRRQIGADQVKILADIFIKHAAPLASVDLRPIEHVAYDTVNAGMAEGVVVTGPRTGLPVDLNDLRAVRGAIRGKFLLVGSGTTADNLTQSLEFADGAIVGTYFKKDGVIENPVEENRVRALTGMVKAASGSVRSAPDLVPTPQS